MYRELVSNRSLFIVVCGPIRTPEGSLQLERKSSGNTDDWRIEVHAVSNPIKRICDLLAIVQVRIVE